MQYNERMILFHGTPDKIVVPTYGKGDEKHDYGQGFYLTENIGLAKEWAVCRQKMRKLVDSDANRVTKVFSTLFKE